jgi:hypothetical protein
MYYNFFQVVILKVYFTNANLQIYILNVYEYGVQNKTYICPKERIEFTCICINNYANTFERRKDFVTMI